MDAARLRRQRQRSHLLSAPAPTLAAAAGHMTAVQAQEFWGGRWALAARTRGVPTLAEVDAAFGRGELIRAWTMRGTLHVLDPADLGWILSVTGERQRRQSAATHRSIGLDAGVIATAERAARAALTGGGRLTRAELSTVLAGAGIDPGGMRAAHLISALCLAQVLCLGPVVPRAGAPTREQYLVLAEEWIGPSRHPSDPPAELFVRYLHGHAPAGSADFAWWAGLPVGVARQAAEAAADRIVEIEEGLFAPIRAATRRTASTPRVRALPPFEEYYLSYADRTRVCAAGFTAHIGPSINGIVRPILVADGEIVGVWSHSLAAGKHHLPPRAEVFADASVPASDLDAALGAYTRFLTG